MPSYERFQESIITKTCHKSEVMIHPIGLLFLVANHFHRYNRLMECLIYDSFVFEVSIHNVPLDNNLHTSIYKSSNQLTGHLGNKVIKLYSNLKLNLKATT